MSMSRNSVPENSTAGLGLRSIPMSISTLLSRFRAPPDEQSRGKGSSGHLGRRRAIRLSALLAPHNRLRVAAATGIVLAAGAVLGSLAFRSPETVPLQNAIWLDRTWTYGDLESDRLRNFTTQLVDNKIGTAYAYVSSLGLDNRWTGGIQGKSSFMDSRGTVDSFVRTFKSHNDNLRVFAWIEIWTHLDRDDGYRLDDANLHSNIADFSRLLVTQLGFDGVLLDVKPLRGKASDYGRHFKPLWLALQPQLAEGGPIGLT